VMADTFVLVRKSDGWLEGASTRDHYAATVDPDIFEVVKNPTGSGGVNTVVANGMYRRATTQEIADHPSAVALDNRRMQRKKSKATARTGDAHQGILAAIVSELNVLRALQSPPLPDLDIDDLLTRYDAAVDAKA